MTFILGFVSVAQLYSFSRVAVLKTTKVGIDKRAIGHLTIFNHEWAIAGLLPIDFVCFCVCVTDICYSLCYEDSSGFLLDRSSNLGYY